MLQRSNSFESEDEEEEKNEEELQEENKEETKQKEDLEKMEESKHEGRVGGEEEIDERVKKDAVRLEFLYIVALFFQSLICNTLWEFPKGLRRMRSGWYCSNKLTLPILLNFSHFSQSGFKASDNVVQKLTYHPSRCFHLYCKYFIQSDHLS